MPWLSCAGLRVIFVGPFQFRAFNDSMIEFIPSQSLTASPVWSKSFTSHMMNHISQQASMAIKAKSAFSPVSSRDSIPCSGPVLSLPVCSGPAHPPLTCRWPLPGQLISVLIFLPDENTRIWDRNQTACLIPLNSQVPNS